LPLFDETDRVEPRSLFTFGMTSRLYGKLSAPLSETVETQPTEGLDENDSPSQLNGIDQQLNYSGGSQIKELARLQIEQAYDVNHVVGQSGSRWSDLDSSLHVSAGQYGDVGGQLGYAPGISKLAYSSVFLTLQPTQTPLPHLLMGRALMGSFVQASYNYIASSSSAESQANSSAYEFATVRSYWDLFDRLGLFLAPSYDFVHSKMVSVEYGVRLKSPCNCWAMDVGITKSVNPDEVSVQFQITLGGIGSLGENPFGRNPFQRKTSYIPGY